MNEHICNKNKSTQQGTVKTQQPSKTAPQTKIKRISSMVLALADQITRQLNSGLLDMKRRASEGIRFTAVCPSKALLQLGIRSCHVCSAQASRQIPSTDSLGLFPASLLMKKYPKCCPSSEKMPELLSSALGSFLCLPCSGRAVQCSFYSFSWSLRTAVVYEGAHGQLRYCCPWHR